MKSFGEAIPSSFPKEKAYSEMNKCKMRCLVLGTIWTIDYF